MYTILSSIYQIHGTGKKRKNEYSQTSDTQWQNQINNHTERMNKYKEK